MADIVNDRDLRLHDTVPRLDTGSGAGLLVLASAQSVRYDEDGHYPPLISVEAVQFVAGVVTWEVDGATLAGTGNKRTITSTTFTKDQVTVTATVTPVGGAPRSHSVTIQRVTNGTIGADGQRGAGHYYAVGSSWSDVVASMACPGGPVINDVVTISDGATFVMEKRFDSTAWVPTGVVLDGSLLVTNSVKSAAIDTRGLSIRDAQGNIILAAGSALPDAYVPPSAQNSQLLPAIALAKNESFSPLKLWDFSDGNYDDWSSMGMDFTVGTSTAILDSTTADPALYSPDLSFSGVIYDRVRMRIRRTAGASWSGQLFFVVQGAPYNYTEANSKRNTSWSVDPTTGGAWTIVEWDLADNSVWTTSTVIGLRIDLSGSADDTFEVDWISVGRVGVGSDDLRAELNAIASDNVLARGEKSAVIREWATIYDEHMGIYNQASDLGLITQRDAYYNKVNALSNYLTALSPAWNDLTKDTPIVGSAFRTAFNDYYVNKQALVNAIAATGGDWSTVTNRPDDPLNLVSKSVFENGSIGTWAYEGTTADGNMRVPTIANVAGQLFTKAIQFTGRDYYNQLSAFPVVPGEVLYLEAFLDATNATQTVAFGLAFKKADGAVFGWNGPVQGTAGSGWALRRASLTVPGEATMAIPWLQNGVTYPATSVGRAAKLRVARFQGGATVGATAGSNLTDTQGNVITDEAIKNNLLNLAWWKRGGALSVADTNIETTTLLMTGTDAGVTGIKGPKGVDDVVAYCKETTLENGVAGAGGGWNGYYLNLNPTKTYRFVVPIRKISGTGSAYWGTQNVCDLNTTNVNDNPYFANTSGLTLDRWYLFVGFIFPAGSTGNTHDSAGIWDCRAMKKVGSGMNWNFRSGDGSVNHRAYQYYASNGAEQAFGRPMINLVDGTEPPLREFFENPQLGENIGGQITAGNASTLIASAAIGLAHINTATITNLRALSADIGKFTSGTPGGARTDISGPAIKIYDTGNMNRVLIGKYT